MVMRNRLMRSFTILTMLAVLILCSPRAYAAGTRLLLAKASGGTNSAVITWEKVSGAQRYTVYFHYCDGKALTSKLTTLNKAKTSFTKKGLKASACYKFRVVAEKKVNGKYTAIAKSTTMHVKPLNSRNLTNPSAVSAAPGSVLVSVGDQIQVKASVKKAEAKKKLLGKGHGAKIRWYSSDKTVAKVDQKGKITAVKTGKCRIYAVAINGVYKAVPVTVRDAKVRKEEVPADDTEAAKTYSVTYKYTGDVPSGAAAVPAEKSYEAGAAVEKAAVPSLTGYTFKGWYGEVTSMPEKDVTVTGHWKLNEHTVKFEYTDPVKQKKVTETVKYGYGEAVEAIADPVVRGYKFDGWKGLPKTMPDEDVTVAGTFTKMCRVTAVLFGTPGVLPEDEKPEAVHYNFDLYSLWSFAVVEKVEFEVEPGVMTPDSVLKKFSKVGDHNVDRWYTEKNKFWGYKITGELYTRISNLRELAFKILWGEAEGTFEENGIPEPSARLARFAELGRKSVSEMTPEERAEYQAIYANGYYTADLNEWEDLIKDTVIEELGLDKACGTIDDDILLIGWVVNEYGV